MKAFYLAAPSVLLATVLVFILLFLGAFRWRDSERGIHGPDTQNILRFEYHGRSYIRFGYAESRSVVHDPDCKCLKDKK